ncbi:sugar ABC transporter permease [Arthrobacter sp. SW1]|uniref:carbohydrate ABC transporter permease n=1 Tax=Arthrobacter sp. SW1 TaxID=1920889 RepID=UPI000B093D91|nr:sugar ABC transporter permease [Arthrobacter sp. SW1]
MSNGLAPKLRRPSGYWLYLLPIFIGFLAVVGIPFGMNIYYSLFRWKGGTAPMRWNGLNNYVQLFEDVEFWTSLRNSIFMVVAIVVIPTAIGLLLAALLTETIGRRFGPRIASFLRATYYLPQILPIAVAGFMWSWILDPSNGAINTFLQSLGADGPDWLGNPDLAIYAVMLMLIWLQIGYPLVIFMAALSRVDPELYEAAALDGAGKWRQVLAISLPTIRPEIFIVVLTATVAALKVFAPILILTGGGPEGSTVVPSYYAYRNFFELSQVGYGSTISTVMALVIFAIAALMLWWQRRQEAQ